MVGRVHRARTVPPAAAGQAAGNFIPSLKPGYANDRF